MRWFVTASAVFVACVMALIICNFRNRGMQAPFDDGGIEATPDDTSVTWLRKRIESSNGGIEIGKVGTPSPCLEGGACTWSCSSSPTHLKQDARRFLGQFEPGSFHRLEQAMARGPFRDDGGWATPILSEFSISTLRVWTDESQPVSARLEHLLIQLSLLAQYVDSMQHVEPLSLALHEMRNTLGLMCSLLRESPAQELSSDLRNEIRVAIAPWQGARADMVKSLDRDYRSMLPLLRLPEWHRPDLMLAEYRYDPVATTERFDRCFRDIRLMAQGKKELSEPPCRRDDHALWWLCNATGKYLAESPAVGLWVEVKTGTRVSIEIRHEANALANVLN